ncbi:hypothetical protein ES703_57392 [subsurface metagenome]
MLVTSSSMNQSIGWWATTKIRSDPDNAFNPFSRSDFPRESSCRSLSSQENQALFNPNTPTRIDLTSSLLTSAPSGDAIQWDVVPGPVGSFSMNTLNLGRIGTLSYCAFKVGSRNVGTCDRSPCARTARDCDLLTSWLPGTKKIRSPQGVLCKISCMGQKNSSRNCSYSTAAPVLAISPVIRFRLYT